jgi:hypothetical protein
MTDEIFIRKLNFRDLEQPLYLISGIHKEYVGGHQTVASLINMPTMVYIQKLIEYGARTDIEHEGYFNTKEMAQRMVDEYIVPRHIMGKLVGK